MFAELNRVLYCMFTALPNPAWLLVIFQVSTTGITLEHNVKTAGLHGISQKVGKVKIKSYNLVLNVDETIERCSYGCVATDCN